MSTEVKVPPLGESIIEATVTRWFKKIGESVSIDEPLVELETDKITIEVPAPATGVLEKCVVVTGDTVTVGSILGLIAEIDTIQSNDYLTTFPNSYKKTSSLNSLKEENSLKEDSLSPAVRRIVAEQTLTPSLIPATGRGGRLTKEDVINFQSADSSADSLAPISAESPPQSPPQKSHPDTRGANRAERRVRMSRLRQRIATRLKDAQNTAAMLTTFNEVDMTDIISLRQRHREAFEKKYKTRLGFMTFFTQACVAALKAFPAVNAEIDGDEILYKDYCHIGIAVSTSQGLVVPVVRDADLKCFAAIETEVADLVLRARNGQLSVADLRDGTFTITNGGIYGSLMSTPILNVPQSGILGMHKIQLRPVVGADGLIQTRQMMYVALSYDHRIIDGREAVSFLVRVKECIEDPIRLLLDV